MKLARPIGILEVIEMWILKTREPYITGNFRRFYNIVILISANDVCIHQSQTTKYNIKEVKLYNDAVYSGAITMQQGVEAYNRLQLLNFWISEGCTEKSGDPLRVLLWFLRQA